MSPASASVPRHQRPKTKRLCYLSVSNDLTVKFGGGESELIVDPGGPVTRTDGADRHLIKSGAKVRLQGVRTADGASVSRITLQ